MKKFLKCMLAIALLIALGYCIYKSVILCFVAWPYLLTSVVAIIILYIVFFREKKDKKENQTGTNRFDEFLIK